MSKYLKSVLCLLFALSLVILPVLNQPTAQAAESNPVSSLSKEEFKKHAFKDGKLIKALDSEEISQVMQEGISFAGKIGEAPTVKRHTFDDGSSIVVTSGVTIKDSNTRGVRAAEKSGTARTTYTCVSAIGLELWTYTLYQEFKYNGSDITWFEKSPYSSHTSSNLLDHWELTSEGAMYTDYAKVGDGITAYTNPKFKFKVWELALQSLTLKGELHISPNGIYRGYWKEVN